MKMIKRQQELDMLHGPIWNKLLLLALPLAATGILQQLFNAVDVAVVGTYVGGAAMAAVGSNSSVVSLLVNLFLGLSLGANVMIAQYIGQGRSEEIRKTIHTSILLAAAGGTALALCGQVLADPVLSLLSVPEEVSAMASVYLRIYLAGMPVILLYDFETAILRSVGDTRTPLVVLTISGVINVALNLFFVVRLGMTVDGVAIATVASNAVSAAVLFVVLCHRKGDVRIDLRALSMDPESLKSILRIGLPAGVQGMVFSLANICVQSAINSLDTIVMAASSAAYNLEMFTFCMLTSFGQACTTIVGQNYGAGKMQRCRRTLWSTLLIGAGCYAVSGGLILFFAEDLLSLFNRDPEVIAYGLTRLRYIFAGQTFSLFVEVLSGYLRGFGRSTAPAVCSLVFVCGIRILWVYAVFPLYPTFAGLMTVYPISICATAVVIAVICVFGSGKRTAGSI